MQVGVRGEGECNLTDVVPYTYRGGDVVQVGRKRMQVGRGEEDGGGETMWGEGRRCW